VGDDAPPRSSWGLWGSHDVFGCLNLLSAEKVTEAARLVRTGKVFALNWAMELPDPPLFGRSPLSHTVIKEGPWQDEELTLWNTQTSSQWDGFRHVRSADYGYYGGVPNGEHGIHHWARKGIVGRGVLVDLARYRRSVGRPLSMSDPDPITAQELADAITSSPVTVGPGDILLLRTGWIEWYVSLRSDERSELSKNLRAPGLRPGKDLLEVVWDLHIAAIAADNPSVEVYPPQPAPAIKRSNTVGGRQDESDLFSHFALLPLLGLPLGELFDLSSLAEDCAADGIYEGFFTSAPLNLRGGVASPPNALVIK